MIIRSFDLFFSIIALFILSPLLFLTVIILKFTGEREIFYFQERVGRKYKSFRLIKFATMLKDSPNLGTKTLTIKNDSRILPFGKVLRNTKINELPQLINIIKGDMSIIGPRPVTNEAFESYSEESKKLISTVRPGLSGIGSIIFRHEEEIMQGENANTDFYKNIIAPYKGNLEKWFVLNKSLIIYFQCILVTIFVVLKPKTHLPWKIFKDLPNPPSELTEAFKINS